MRTLTTRICLTLGAVLIGLAGCEAVARWLLTDGPAAAKVERREFSAKIPPEGTDASSGYMLHPFFGYTFSRGARGANNQGFFGPEYPYRKRSGEFVVGIFGGSVALQAAAEGQRWLTARLNPALAARGYTRTTVLSFAVGGWRQPQSFIAMAHFLPSLDLAIVIDGFNEVIHLGDDALGSFPASFPWRDVYIPLARSLESPDEILRRAHLIEENRRASRFTKAFGRPVLRWSMLAHLVWRGLANRYLRRAGALRESASQELASEWRGVEPVQNGDYGQKRDAYLRFYADLIRNSDAIARRDGTLFFHFVQPNQYDRGSKALSEEEKQRRITNTTWFDRVTPFYRRLENITENLRQEGIESRFLGRIFAPITETVYKDDCCHLNERGLEIMNTTIADAIISSGQLATLTSRPRETADPSMPPLPADSPTDP